MADALLKTPVAHHHPSVVIHQFAAVLLLEHTMRQCHTHAVGETLSQGSGSDLNRRGNSYLWMTRGATVWLAKRFQIIARDVVTESMRKPVLEN